MRTALIVGGLTGVAVLGVIALSRRGAKEQAEVTKETVVTKETTKETKVTHVDLNGDVIEGPYVPPPVVRPWATLEYAQTQKEKREAELIAEGVEPGAGPSGGRLGHGVG